MSGDVFTIVTIAVAVTVVGFEIWRFVTGRRVWRHSEQGRAEQWERERKRCLAIESKRRRKKGREEKA